MAKKITIGQLRRAIDKAPAVVKKEAQIFLQRGISEYKRVAVQSAPWRIGQSGGGIPRDTGNLKEQHYTRFKDWEGRFGPNTSRVPYAGAVYKGTRHMEGRPWLQYAKNRADSKVTRHYNTMLDNIIEHIAT